MEEIFENNQEYICSMCADIHFGGSVNTCPYNLCEGCRCTDMVEYFKETDVFLSEMRRHKIKMLLDLNNE